MASGERRASAQAKAKAPSVSRDGQCIGATHTGRPCMGTKKKASDRPKQFRARALSFHIKGFFSLSRFSPFPYSRQGGICQLLYHKKIRYVSKTTCNHCWLQKFAGGDVVSQLSPFLTGRRCHSPSVPNKRSCVEKLLYISPNFFD